MSIDGKDTQNIDGMANCYEGISGNSPLSTAGNSVLAEQLTPSGKTALENTEIVQITPEQAVKNEKTANDVSGNPTKVTSIFILLNIQKSLHLSHFNLICSGSISFRHIFIYIQICISFPTGGFLLRYINA